MRLFQFQAKNCKPYSDYLRLIGCDAKAVSHPEKIPFLPVEIFKTHDVKCYTGDAELIFKSSGTTGMQQSIHHVNESALYQLVIRKIFQQNFGNPNNYCFLGLLPSYLERQNASLVYMVKTLMDAAGHPQSGFYLNEHETLREALLQLAKSKQPTVLFGVSFALLDFAAGNEIDFPGLTVIETGGMKGRGRELIREELHYKLKNCFKNASLASEYGMTELMSHAYSVNDKGYRTPPWMKVIFAHPDEPLGHTRAKGQSGRIKVIDLANCWSCAFIQTADLGRMNEDGSFSVLGRMDYSDLRGCSLMV